MAGVPVLEGDALKAVRHRASGSAQQCRDLRMRLDRQQPREDVARSVYAPSLRWTSIAQIAAAQLIMTDATTRGDPNGVITILGQLCEKRAISSSVLSECPANGRIFIAHKFSHDVLVFEVSHED